MAFKAGMDGYPTSRFFCGCAILERGDEDGIAVVVIDHDAVLVAPRRFVGILASEVRVCAVIEGLDQCIAFLCLPWGAGCGR